MNISINDSSAAISDSPPLGFRGLEETNSLDHLDSDHLNHNRVRSDEELNSGPSNSPPEEPMMMPRTAANHEMQIPGSAERLAKRERPVTREMPQAFSDELVQIFKLLSDETRLKILYLLGHDPELHVRALCELLNQSQPAVSHHLALLREAGLLASRRDGKHNFYRLVPQRFRELLEKILAAVPLNEDRQRFQDFVTKPSFNSQHEPKHP